MADGEVGEALGEVLVVHPPLALSSGQALLLPAGERPVLQDVRVAPLSLRRLVIRLEEGSKLTVHSEELPQGFLILTRRSDLDSFDPEIRRSGSDTPVNPPAIPVTV